MKPVDVKQDRPRIRFLSVPSSDHTNGDHGSFFHFVPQAQSASAVAGPYVTLAAAVSPYTNTLTGASQFFRLMKP